MADRSRIEHVDATWNPVSGCRPCSPGCAHCYAARLTAQHDPGRDFREIRIHPERLEVPAAWRHHRRILVCSMRDLFHPEVPPSFIRRVFRTMATAPQHTFLVLSKHPDRMGPVLRGEGGERGVEMNQGLSHVWLGTSTEDQTWADRRLPALPHSGWPGRFWVSTEPLLGDLDLRAYLPGLSWAVGGGESGPGAPIRTGSGRCGTSAVWPGCPGSGSRGRNTSDVLTFHHYSDLRTMPGAVTALPSIAWSSVARPA
jgi:protein gp37